MDSALYDDGYELDKFIALDKAIIEFGFDEHIQDTMLDLSAGANLWKRIASKRGLTTEQAFDESLEPMSGKHKWQMVMYVRILNIFAKLT